MQNNSNPQYSVLHYLAAWSVHALTASTAVVGLYTLYAIVREQYILAFWLMGVAIFIDAIDGTLARLVKVNLIIPKIDGALLDNMVDYLNYVITPCFLLLMHQQLLPPIWGHIIIGIIVLTSAYQFTQRDAKTIDHFFKGFPCYWNFVVFYLFLLNMTPMTNSIILLVLSLLIFVPIKYVYPSRMDYLTTNPALRKMMLVASIVYGLVGIGILLSYPNIHYFFIIYSVAYIIVYFGFSLYRTFVPLKQ